MFATVILFGGQKQFTLWNIPREGNIIECPQYDLFHDRRDVIMMSQMAVINISLAVAVN